MTMVKVWFKIPKWKDEDWQKRLFEKLRGELKTMVGSVDVLNRFDGETGYFGGQEIALVEVYIDEAEKTALQLKKEGFEPLFVF